jgi:hypothetical protein
MCQSYAASGASGGHAVDDRWHLIEAQDVTRQRFDRSVSHHMLDLKAEVSEVKLALGGFLLSHRISGPPPSGRTTTCDELGRGLNQTYHHNRSRRLQRPNRPRAPVSSDASTMRSSSSSSYSILTKFEAAARTDILLHTKCTDRNTSLELSSARTVRRDTANLSF